MPKRRPPAAVMPMAGHQYLVYASVRRLVFLIAGSVAFAVAGVALILAGGLVPLVCGVASVLIGALAIVAAVQLARTRTVPVIAFDAEGVAFRGPFEKQFVRWDTVEAAYIASVQRQRFVCLRTSDVERILAETGPARRRLMEANVALTGAPFALPTTSTLGPEELLAVVAAYLHAFRSGAP